MRKIAVTGFPIPACCNAVLPQNGGVCQEPLAAWHTFPILGQTVYRNDNSKLTVVFPSAGTVISFSVIYGSSK